MSEKALWNRVRVGLETSANARGMNHDFQRIESTLTASGIPDVNYCLQEGMVPPAQRAPAHRGWCELKHGDKPARQSTVVFKSQPGLRPEQIDWILYRMKCGDRCHILAQVGTTLLLVSGVYAAHFNLWTFNEMRDASIWVHDGNCSARDWDELLFEMCISNRLY